VSYSAGWYGPNEKNWFEKVFPRRTVIPYGYHIVVANWSARSPDERWPGQGHSCVISREGKVLAAAKSLVGNEVVVADLEAATPSQAATPSR